MENKKLRQISADYTRVKRVFGPEQVEAAGGGRQAEGASGERPQTATALP